MIYVDKMRPEWAPIKWKDRNFYYYYFLPKETHTRKGDEREAEGEATQT